MTIILSFAGGCMNDAILLSGADRRDSEQKAVERYYLESAGGEIGRRFHVARDDGFDVYEVVLRLEVDDRVIVRAVHQVTAPEYADVNQAMRRHK